MRRQTDNGLTTRVYSYGTVPPRIAPVCGEDVGHAQLRLANRLWNVLVAIERARIARYRIIMDDAEQARITELREQIATLRHEAKARRKQARARADISDLTAAISEARSEMARLVADRKNSSRARHDARRAELTALQERTNHRIKRARQAAASMGLFWGTYNDIVQRADAGRKLGELKFRRFTGDGTLTAQIMGGAEVARCVGGEHTFFRIGPPTPGQKWRYADMRIGSTDRAPVWLSIPIVYHRDVPAGADIKSVSMTKRGGRWQLNVTVSVPRPHERTTGPVIAIDIGWRLLPAGVRVAYWCDNSSAHGQVLVSASDIDQLQRVPSLRSTCDRMRDEFLPSLAEWLSARELPEAWRERIVAIAQWRSGDRIAALIRWWADNRLPGDAEIFMAAVGWRKQYLHLTNWWRNLSEQMRARIREQYRVFAAGVARKYGAVCIEEFDLRKVAERPDPESKDIRTASASYRQMVSPSEMRAALLNACQREGVRVIRVSAGYTTRNCHVCGTPCVWDQAEEVMHRCAACGALWDQDYNAARNILDLGRERLGGEHGESVTCG